jgi:lysophospholipase L1-like esterase
MGPGQSAEAEPRKTVSRLARLYRGLFAFSVSFLVVCAAAEITLRLIDDRAEAVSAGTTALPRHWVDLMDAGVFGAIDDPVRRYAMNPGADVTLHDDVTGEDWRFRVNGNRARGPELPPEKPRAERRILCLGDSFAFGLWCDEAETLVGHLARLVDDADPTETTWRGITIGVPGYHTGQQLAAFEQDGLALDPDLVVLYFNTNDIMRDGFFFDDEHAVVYSDHAPLPARMRRLLWNSHLYGFLTRKLLTDRFRRIPSPHLDRRVPYAHIRADNQAYCREALARIAELCRARGIPLFAVNQPLMTWSDAARGRNWKVLPLVDWADRTFDELGIPHVGLLGWMRGYADGVDRIAGLVPDQDAPAPDFRPDFFFADPVVQTWVKAFRAGSPLPESELPEEPDFHLLGAGYESMARVAFPALRDLLRDEGLLP